MVTVGRYVLLFLVCSSLCSAANQTLNFMFFTSLSGIVNQSGTVPAVDMALDIINSNSSLLPGYNLSYGPAVLDSQCNGQRSLETFVEEVLTYTGTRRENQTQYVGIVGAGCSAATMPVARLAPFANMPMISYASTLDGLSNRDIYRTYYRTILTEQFLVGGFVSLIELHNWTQIAFITQEEEVFISIEDEVREALAPDGVDVRGSRFDSEEDPLDTPDLFLTQLNMRIIVLNVYASTARRILCHAYHGTLNNTLPRHTWILFGWYSEGWWNDPPPDNRPDDPPCTGEQILWLINGSLAMIHYPIANDGDITFSGLNYSEFVTEYRARQEAAGVRYTEFAQFAFDAVWTLAIALNSSIEKIAAGDDSNCTDTMAPLVPYSQFNYSNDKLLCILNNALSNTNFLGVTGFVKFNETGNRESTTVRLQQYRAFNNSRTRDILVTVARLYPGKDSFQFEDNEGFTETLWPDGVPRDGSAEYNITFVNLEIIVILYVLAFAGIVFAIICLIFNIVFRKNRVVKVTSPKLNYLIIAGAMLLYLFVIMSSIHEYVRLSNTVMGTLCNIGAMMTVGTTLCFAVVLAKLARLYYLFTDPSPNKKILKDWHLLCVIVFITAIDVIILLVPIILESSRLRSKSYFNTEQPEFRDEDGIPQRQNFTSCGSLDGHQAIWLGVSGGYKLLLQVIAVYFAFRTRNINIKALNDSKEIAVISYITSLILLAIVALSAGAANNSPNVYTAVLGLLYITYSTVILGGVFLPKMVVLYKDPEGETVLPLTAATVRGFTGFQTSQEEKMVALERRIEELELLLNTEKLTSRTLRDRLTAQNKSGNGGSHEATNKIVVAEPCLSTVSSSSTVVLTESSAGEIAAADNELLPSRNGSIQ